MTIPWMACYSAAAGGWQSAVPLAPYGYASTQWLRMATSGNGHVAIVWVDNGSVWVSWMQ